jgi:5-formyltetrahydrofolate cyclo-ligase
MVDRAELRAERLARRRALTPATVAEASAAVVARVLELPMVVTAARLALYRAVRGEIVTDDIATWAWAADRRVYLPMTEPPRTMRFGRWREGDALVRSPFGIEEPAPSSRTVAPTRLDLVCVPLVAFDRRGSRLGHGAGYYDATFAFRLSARPTRPWLVGLAHASQEIDAIERRPWDVPLDLVVTDAEVIECRPGALRH